MIYIECEDGFFGSDCTSVCGHCLNANQCHLSNGTCLNGCSPGYIGTQCEESTFFQTKLLTVAYLSADF